MGLEPIQPKLLDFKSNVSTYFTKQISYLYYFKMQIVVYKFVLNNINNINNKL